MRKYCRLTAFWVVYTLLVAAVSICVAADRISRYDRVALGPTRFETGRLNLAPGTTAASGIYFGKDATLYRSAANTIKTDDAVSIAGSTTLGDTSTDAVTFTGRTLVRQVANVTTRPGTEGEIVYNLADDKLYVCTTGSETSATWAKVGAQAA